MNAFIRFIGTITGMVVIKIILSVLRMLVFLITCMLITQGGFETTTAKTIIVLIILVFTFVTAPYSLIVTYVLYSGLSKLKTKKYGLLAGGFTQGICSWVLNTITLPYYLISLKYPPQYELTSAPPKNYTLNFIIGWIIGLIICFIFSSLMLILALRITEPDFIFNNG